MKSNIKRIVLILLILVLGLVMISLVEYLLIVNIRKTQNERDEQLAIYKELESDNLIFTNGVRTHGQLRTEGAKLVDENGMPFQLRGMSSHGLLWYPEYTNYQSVLSTRAYGANSFRIAMYANEVNGGYVQQPDLSLKLMYAAIENVLAADMYAIVDWHVLSEKNPLQNTQEAIQFFEKVASHYGNEPGIIYEICNEPNGDTTWTDIVAYANQVIPVIRTYAPDAIILVGTPKYSYNIVEVIGNTLPYQNILYSYHFYAGQFGNEYENMIADCHRNNVPIFVSEWGINEEQGGEASIQQGKEFVTYLNENAISWNAWALCNKDETFAAIRPECSKYSNWTEEDLTKVGQIFCDGLAGQGLE